MNPEPASPPPWWRHAVIYEIYVRSFSDADGDGVGDLRGIRDRLGELRDLGIDAVWLTPFYRSPQADGGYDVADHCAVDPLFGSLSDFDELVTTAHQLGLRVLVDLVPNHTSIEHEWFQAAVAAGPGSTERARYLFRDGRGAGGGEPPNDWMSVFGGPAWSRITEAGGEPGQWYLHLFASEQPDLDWTNPEVHALFESTLRFWLDRDVDGFRIDVAHALVKAPGLPDLDGRFPPRGLATPGHPHWDRDEVHDIYRRWRQVLDEYPGDRVFVAEAYLPDPGRLARYLRPDELHSAFNFDLLLAPWDASALRRVVDRNRAAMAEVGAPPTWVLSNHDMVRHVTRSGGGAVGVQRARAAALLMLSLPGGAYVYQGEELGLPEVTDLPARVRQDPTFFRTGGAEPGRDGCRVPLPWSDATASLGFSPTGASWLPQPADWVELTRADQSADAESMLWLYREALRLRRDHRLGQRDFAWIETHPDVLAYRLGPDVICVVNVGDAPVDVAPIVGPAADILLTSAPLADRQLPGATGAWLATGS